MKFVFSRRKNVLSDGVRIWHIATNPPRTYLNWRSSHRNAIFMVDKVCRPLSISAKSTMSFFPLSTASAPREIMRLVIRTI